MQGIHNLIHFFIVDNERSMSTDIDLSEYVENIIIFATGLLFGFHMFGKDGGWWGKPNEKRNSSEYDTDDEEVCF